MRYILSIHFIFTTIICSAQLLSFPSNSSPGRADETAPAITITTGADDPVVGSGVTITATITASKPVTGLVVGDITTVNCTLSGFTGSGASYSVTVDPTASGTFSIQIPAARCTAGGIDNTASNTLSLTYVDDSGEDYDLENAVIAVSKHYRGHVASFSDTDDQFSTNAPGCEMWGFKYNFGLTVYNNGKDATQENAYDNGRLDFGCYASGSNYTTLQALIAQIRNDSIPTTLSYPSGITTHASAARSLYLGGRNSVYDTASIDYGPGLTDMDLISRALTFRQEYYSAQTTGTPFQLGSEADGKAILGAVVPRVIYKGDWFSNFFHWHRATLNYARNYFHTMDSLINGADVFYGSYNTVVEYYFVRESVTSVTGNVSTLTINYAKDYPGSPYNLIQTPVWIRVDLTGTIYDGQGITTSHGGKIRSMGGNVYYISCYLNFDNTSTAFDILTTPSPSYINLEAPIINRSGTSVTSDQAVKAVLFRKLKTEPLEMKVAIAPSGRFTSFSTAFTLPALNTATYDYYLGYINAEGISGLIQF